MYVKKGVSKEKNCILIKKLPFSYWLYMGFLYPYILIFFEYELRKNDELGDRGSGND